MHWKKDCSFSRSSNAKPINIYIYIYTKCAGMFIAHKLEEVNAPCKPFTQLSPQPHPLERSQPGSQVKPSRRLFLYKNHLPVGLSHAGEITVSVSSLKVTSQLIDQMGGSSRSCKDKEVSFPYLPSLAWPVCQIEGRCSLAWRGRGYGTGTPRPHGNVSTCCSLPHQWYLQAINNRHRLPPPICC